MAKSSEVVFSLRIDENLYKKIRMIAENDRRSINNQIITVLDKFIAGFEKKNGIIKIEE